MEWVWYVMVGVFPSFFFPGTVAGVGPDENFQPLWKAERYWYRAITIDDKNTEEEQVWMQVRKRTDGFEYLSRALAPGTREVIRVHADPISQRVSAEKDF